MIQGTTPTLYFAFGIDLSTLKEWKVVFAQEDKDNLVKTQADCLIGENNIIYLKLSQEETLALDYTKLVEIQAKVLTTDNNVFASNLVRTTVGKILDKTQYSAENGEILPVGNEKIIDLTFDTTCGFALEFGDQIVYRESPIDKELNKDSENAIANKTVYEAVKALEKLIAESGGGSVTITIDKEINAESTNPVENQAIAKALDNKLDKIVSQGSFNRVLTLTSKKGSTDIATIIIHSGSDAFISPSSIAQRKGTALWAETPADDSTDAHIWDLINREHLNEKLEGYVKSSTSTSGSYVYTRSNGQEGTKALLGMQSTDRNNIGGFIPTYTVKDGVGQLYTGTPTTDFSATNKIFVEEKIAEVGGGEWIKIPQNQDAEQSEEDGMFNVWGWKFEGNFIRFFGTTNWEDYLISVNIPFYDMENSNGSCLSGTFMLNAYYSPRGILIFGNSGSITYGYWEAIYPVSPDAFGIQVNINGIDISQTPEEILTGAKVYALKIR